MNNRQKIQDAKKVDLASIYSVKTNSKGNKTWVGDNATQFYINSKGDSRANDFRGNNRSNIDFVSEVEGLDFIESVDFLLEYAGINTDMYYNKEDYKRFKNKQNINTESIIKNDKKLFNIKELVDNFINKEDFKLSLNFLEDIENFQSLYGIDLTIGGLNIFNREIDNLIKNSEDIQFDSLEDYILKNNPEYYKQKYEVKRKLEDFQTIEKKEKDDFIKILNDNRIKDNKGSFFYLVAIRGIDKDLFKFLYDNKYIVRGSLNIEGDNNNHDRKVYKKEWDNGIKYDKSMTYFIYRDPIMNSITGITARSNQDKNKFQRNFSGCEWGFGISKGDIEKITVLEAPIDLLSYLTYFKGEEKLNNNYLFATAGTNIKLIKNNLKKLEDSLDKSVKEIVVAVDNDKGGDRYFELIKKHFGDKYLITRDSPKTRENDWNDELLK